MMSEKSGLRSLALIIASLCVAAFATTALGCASGSASTSDGADKPAEKVSGEPPSPEEDTPKPLPKGPKVEMGNAPADAGENAGESADASKPDASKSDAGDASGESQEQSDEPSASFTRSEVQTFMQKGPSFALTLVRVEPARSDGKFQGFKITDMKPVAANTVAPLLETGDVITHINGVRMEKPDDYLNAWKLLSEVDTVRIDFVRDGSSEHAVWLIK